ncbi:unnamed protein product, partial [Prorocentrum cordatum]
FEERIGASVSPAPGSKGQGERPRKQATLPASGLALEEAARAGHAASLRPRAREGGRCWPAAKPAAPTERAPARCGLCRRRCRLDASAVVGARGTEIAEHTLEAQAPKIYVCADCPSCAADWPLRPTRQPTRRGLSGRGQRVHRRHLDVGRIGRWIGAAARADASAMQRRTLRAQLLRPP